MAISEYGKPAIRGSTTVETTRSGSLKELAPPTADRTVRHGNTHQLGERSGAFGHTMRDKVA